MLVLALAAVQMRPKAGETLNEEIESRCIRMHEHLISVGISEKTQDVAGRRVGMFWRRHTKPSNENSTKVRN